MVTQCFAKHACLADIKHCCSTLWLTQWGNTALTSTSHGEKARLSSCTDKVVVGLGPGLGLWAGLKQLLLVDFMAALATKQYNRSCDTYAARVEEVGHKPTYQNHFQNNLPL